MIISSSINTSPTRSFTAAESLSGEFTAVSLTKDGVVTAGSSAVPIGILTGGQDTLNAGEDVSVQVFGETLWLTGGQSVNAGDFLAANNGLAVKASSGQFAFGLALENASASSAVSIQIVNAGKI